MFLNVNTVILASDLITKSATDTVAERIVEDHTSLEEDSFAATFAEQLISHTQFAVVSPQIHRLIHRVNDRRIARKNKKTIVEE